MSRCWRQREDRDTEASDHRPVFAGDRALADRAAAGAPPLHRLLVAGVRHQHEELLAFALAEPAIWIVSGSTALSLGLAGYRVPRSPAIAGGGAQPAAEVSASS